MIIRSTQKRVSNSIDNIRSDCSIRDHEEQALKFHFYEEERLQSVYQYNGMFAFGLWDEKASRLWVCRDRLALKFRLVNLVKKFLVFHQFCFTPKFIRRFLRDWGFSRINILNSPPSEGDPHKLFYLPTLAQFIKRSFHMMAKNVEVISGRKILLGTSLEAIAVKRASVTVQIATKAPRHKEQT